MREKTLLVCPYCKNQIPAEYNVDDPYAEPPDAGTQVKCPVCRYEGLPEEVTEEELKVLKKKE